MELRPSQTRPIERFLVATVDKVSRPSRPRSPSVVVMDGNAQLHDTHDPLSGEKIGKLRLRFDSAGLVPLAVGRRYLFALAGDVCLGFFDIDEQGRVALPGQTPRSVEEVARAGLRQTIEQLIGETR